MNDRDRERVLGKKQLAMTEDLERQLARFSSTEDEPALLESLRQWLEELTVCKYDLSDPFFLNPKGVKQSLMDHVILLENNAITTQTIQKCIDVMCSFKISPNEGLSGAIRTGDLELLKHLKKRRANLNFKDPEKDSPLFLAVDCGQVEIIKFLMDSGVSVNRLTTFNDNILHILFMESLAEESLKDVLEWIARHHIESIDINFKNKIGETPLHWAAASRYQDAVSLLLGLGASVNEADNIGNTALHMAVRENQFSNVQALLLSGAPVHQKNKNGESPWDEALKNKEKNKSMADLFESFELARKEQELLGHLLNRSHDTMGQDSVQKSPAPRL